jgi:hypothetical protein
MIHVAIFCAGSRPSAGQFCTPIEDTVPLGDVERWHAETLAKHAWTVGDDDTTYCPKHNPADRGAPVELTSEEYRPLGDSGWEARARMAEDSPAMLAVARIEIRQRRGGDDG